MLVEMVQKSGDQINAIKIFETNHLDNDDFMQAFALIRLTWNMALEIGISGLDVDLEIDIEVDQISLGYEQVNCWEDFRDWYVDAFGCTRLHGSTEWMM